MSRNGDHCPYTHASLAPDAARCHAFAYLGWCDQGAACAHRHTKEAPDTPARAPAAPASPLFVRDDYDAPDEERSPSFAEQDDFIELGEDVSDVSDDEASDASDHTDPAAGDAADVAEARGELAASKCATCRLAAGGRRMLWCARRHRACVGGLWCGWWPVLTGGRGPRAPACPAAFKAVAPGPCCSTPNGWWGCCCFA